MKSGSSMVSPTGRTTRMMTSLTPHPLNPAPWGASGGWWPVVGARQAAQPFHRPPPSAANKHSQLHPSTMTSNQENLSFELRTHRPGDMGLITHHHGIVYTSKPYEWDISCESIAARICADFIDNFKPQKERCWIAEKEGEFLGCVLLIKDPDEDKVARIRLLLVREQARGMGIATRLIQACINFAREAGYRSIFLWTQSILEGARRLYLRAGFVMVDTEEHDAFGQKMMGEKWRLVL